MKEKMFDSRSSRHEPPGVPLRLVQSLDLPRPETPQGRWAALGPLQSAPGPSCRGRGTVGTVWQHFKACMEQCAGTLVGLVALVAIGGGDGVTEKELPEALS